MTHAIRPNYYFYYIKSKLSWKRYPFSGSSRFLTDAYQRFLGGITKQDQSDPKPSEVPSREWQLTLLFTLWKGEAKYASDERLLPTRAQIQDRVSLNIRLGDQGATHQGRGLQQWDHSQRLLHKQVSNAFCGWHKKPSNLAAPQGAEKPIGKRKGYEEKVQNPREIWLWYSWEGRDQSQSLYSKKLIHL